MEFASPQEKRQEVAVREAFDQLAAEVKAYDPTLIITFGPDHFNGFFYDLMPSFCVGIRAKAAGDWDYGKDNDHIDVPEDKALAMVRRVLDEGVDVAYSYRMQADHGVTQHCISCAKVSWTVIQPFLCLLMVLQLQCQPPNVPSLWVVQSVNTSSL